MRIDPQRPLEPPGGHIRARAGVRAGAVVCLVAGAVLLLIGGYEFLMAFVRFGDGRDPSMGRMILMMPGLLLVAVGGQMAMVGWMGAISKFAVREQAPAAAEGINRIGAGASPGIRAVAGAIGAGLRDGAGVACSACGSAQDGDAAFCDDCGARMARACASCGTRADADARYCDACGAAL